MESALGNFGIRTIQVEFIATGDSTPFKIFKTTDAT
jgi:hypothetical protein